MSHPTQNQPSVSAQQHLDKYQSIQRLNLSLDLTRGKPSAAQLELSNRVLSISRDDCISDGVDTRNYGGIDGLPAMKKLFAEILGVEADDVIVGGNSSLTMMYETLSRACLFGVVDGDRPWIEIPERKFLCPTPGYDRHFLITEHLGFELISVDMTESGPDMDQVEALVSEDASIKGIWCVPKFSNPTGACYDAETVRRLASMTCAANDFRIMWDNAYAVHQFSGEPVALDNIAQVAIDAGNPNRVIQFASTSKVSHPGSGVAAMAGSPLNMADARKHIGVQSIGPDKVNQLRHLQLFGDLSDLTSHMAKHAEIVNPKFDLVQTIFEREFASSDDVRWSRPAGGYFISVDVPDGLARRIVLLAAEAGVKLTTPGAPFPYGKDPKDCNIRIAPTFPALDELEQAIETLVVCIQLAIAEST